MGEEGMTVVVVEEGDDVRVRWGTWEELILGGSVMRHGTKDWDSVASELQARTLYPFLFTPEVCRAKYDDLLHCYSGHNAWFEELKKRRVAELKRALEKSEDSIGSLETKLQSLKAGKRGCGIANYSFNQTESPVSFHKLEGDESGKETSKDDLSAGSFTQETRPNWLPECQVPAEETDTKPAALTALGYESFAGVEKLAEAIRLQTGVSIRKKRGERKRKGCLTRDIKEGSVGENNLGSPPNVVNNFKGKENASSDCGHTQNPAGVDDQHQCSSVEGGKGLMGILNTVMENEQASIFRRKLDSQKRARYKKIIRQHMDMDTIRSRIAHKIISSVRELFRDLLLLANNALVFYSKSTREYKYAGKLRHLVSKMLRQHSEAFGDKKPAVATMTSVSKSTTCKRPAKPRSARPFQRHLTGKLPDSENANGGNVTKEGESTPGKVDSVSSVESSAVQKKKSVERRKKAGRANHSSGLQGESPEKARKRAKVR